MRYLWLILACLLTGCTPEPTTPEPTTLGPKSVPVIGTSTRFKVDSYGVFGDPNNDDKCNHGMFVVTDTVTKKRYFVVTGASSTEMPDVDIDLPESGDDGGDE